MVTVEVALNSGFQQVCIPPQYANYNIQADQNLPQANLNPECFKDKLTPQDLGVYYGWCQLRDDPIEPMVMSIGYNPQYGNKELSAVRNVFGWFVYKYTIHTHKRRYTY